MKDERDRLMEKADALADAATGVMVPGIVSYDGLIRAIGEYRAARAQSNNRSLEVDGPKRVIRRFGRVVGKFRSRGTIWRLAMLLATNPGVAMHKEYILRQVWEVRDYHPLRHDQVLFSTIYRLRLLLGDTGEVIPTLKSGGYQFCPPPDFLLIPDVA